MILKKVFFKGNGVGEWVKILKRKEEKNLNKLFLISHFSTEKNMPCLTVWGKMHQLTKCSTHHHKVLISNFCHYSMKWDDCSLIITKYKKIMIMFYASVTSFYASQKVCYCLDKQLT